MTATARPRLVDAAAAAEILGVPKTWVLAEARADRIPHVRLGRYVRFEPEVGDVYRFRAEIDTEVVRDLDGERTAGDEHARLVAEQTVARRRRLWRQAVPVGRLAVPFEPRRRP